MTAWLGIGATLFSVHAVAQSRMLLPTAYEAGHFYATPELVNGKTMRLVVDTGGGGTKGLYVIKAPAARRLGLGTIKCALGGETAELIKAPAFRSGKGLPVSSNTPCHSAAFVIPAEKGMPDTEDGQLGAGYLPEHVWTFDYPAKQLWLEPATWQAPSGAHRTALGFQTNAQSASGMARITLKVDGQPLDLLLDTGATAKPTTAGKEASGTPTEHGIGVTSYITTNVLERWHKAHPDWRIVENGDDLGGPKHKERLIEVPKVEIAGWSVGPVWFTERSDRAFHDYMSSYMDKQVEGSVGGNVFGHFVMTLDYPHSTAYFSCVRGCVAATPPPAP